MFNSFIKKIANRYIWSRKSEAFISIVSIFAVLGVAIGVAVLNITLSIMTGFETELQNKLVGSSHVFIGKVAGNIDNWERVSSSIEEIDGITGVSPYAQGQVMLSDKRSSHGLLIKGIIKDGSAYEELKSYQLSDEEVSSIFTTTKVRNELSTGEVTQADLPNILVGNGLSRKLGLHTDKIVSLISPNVVSGPFGLAPRYKRYNISGFYKSGLSGYEEGLAYTSLKAVQKFFKLGKSITGFEISVNDPKKAPQIKQEIISKLREMKFYDLYVQDWTETNKGLWDAIKLEKRVYFIVLLLLIVLASFSIVTTLVMIVLEKRKDIAVLRTLGASSRNIRNIFIYIGAFIGFSGTVLGLILGYIVCLFLSEFGFELPKNVFPTDTVPVVINISNFILVGVCAFVICLLATIYPARRASKLEPCEILRYE